MTRPAKSPKPKGEGDPTRITVKGLTFTILTPRDDDHEPPWDDGDGNGVVSEWTREEPDPESGDRVLLNEDRGGSRRYFRWAETMAKALDEGWDAPPYQTGTPAEQAERATEREYQRLKDWCTDQWEYIGVQVRLLDEDGHTTRYVSPGLWGIESSDAAYIREVAKEQAEELIDSLPKEIESEQARLDRVLNRVTAAAAKVQP